MLENRLVHVGVNHTIPFFSLHRGFTTLADVHNRKDCRLLNRISPPSPTSFFAWRHTDKSRTVNGFFGAPTTPPEDASNALNAAVAMQRRILGST